MNGSIIRVLMIKGDRLFTFQPVHTGILYFILSGVNSL